MVQNKFNFSNSVSVIALLIALGVLSFQFFKAEKIVYVNTGVVLEKYKGMIDAKKKFEGFSQQWKNNVDTLTNDFQDALKKYEKEQGGMTLKERDLSQDLLRNKQQQLGQYQQAIQQKAQEEESKLTQTELKKINSYMEEYGRKNGFRIILGTSNGNILYADKSIEITNEIIEGLNNEYNTAK